MASMDMVRQIVWYTVVSVFAVFAFFMVIGSYSSAKSEAEENTVQLRDVISQGNHELSGYVMVPSACHQLRVRTEEVLPHVYKLIFTTWEETAVTCAKEPVSRSFRAAVSAPAVGVRFEASLDGKALRVIPPIPEIKK